MATVVRTIPGSVLMARNSAPPWTSTRSTWFVNVSVPAVTTSVTGCAENLSGSRDWLTRIQQEFEHRAKKSAAETSGGVNTPIKVASERFSYLQTMLGLSFARSRQAWCCFAKVAASGIWAVTAALTAPLGV